MNKILFTFLFLITNLFAETPNEPATQDKTIDSLQKYCLKHADLWQGFYNLGRTYYEASDFKNAEENFSNALQKCSDPKEQESIFYNLGNTYFKQFSEVQKEQQIPTLEKCIQNYKSALALNPNAEDTKKNLEIAQKILEKLKEKQQQDKNNQDKKENQDKKDSSQQEKQQNDNQQDQQNNSNSEEKKDQKEQTQKDPSSEKENPQQQKQQSNASTNPEPKAIPQNLKQQEMENILQKEKNNERILPVSFSKNQNISQEKILKDW